MPLAEWTLNGWEIHDIAERIGQVAPHGVGFAIVGAAIGAVLAKFIDPLPLGVALALGITGGGMYGTAEYTAHHPIAIGTGQPCTVLVTTHCRKL